MSYDFFGDTGGLLDTVLDLGQSGWNLYQDYEQWQNAGEMAGQYADLASTSSELQSAIAAQKLALATDQWTTYKDDFLPLYESMLSATTDEIELFAPLKKAQVDQALADLAKYASLKEAQVDEALFDLSLYRPLKEAQVEDALGSMKLYQPLKLAQVEQALADLELYQPLKEAQVQDALQDLETGREVKDAQSRQLLRNLDLYAPLVEQYAKAAAQGEEADTGQVMSLASADVAQAFARQRDSNQRQTAGRGLQPGQAAFADLVMDVEEAAADAAARTRARQTEKQRTEDESKAMLGSALSLLAPSTAGSPASASYALQPASFASLSSSYSAPAAPNLAAGVGGTDFSSLSAPSYGLPSSPLSSVSALLSDAGDYYGQLAHSYAGLSQQAGGNYEQLTQSMINAGTDILYSGLDLLGFNT